jgi:hypothetical protein
VPILDYRGLLDRLRQEATFAGPVQRFSFGSLQLDFSRLGTSPAGGETPPADSPATGAEGSRLKPAQNWLIWAFPATGGRTRIQPDRLN